MGEFDLDFDFSFLYISFFLFFFYGLCTFLEGVEGEVSFTLEGKLSC